MKLTILCIPQPKQSARFRSITVKGKGNEKDRTFIKSYQKKEVVENERNIKFDIKSQLPVGFVPYNVAIGVKVSFVFPPLSSFTKKKMDLLNSGEIIYKETKPDLTDNLMKGLFDAMNGIVYTDDARICRVSSAKFYGIVPRIVVEFYEL